MMDSTQLLEPWRPRSLEAGETRLWQIGPLKLYLYRTEHEWHLASELVREEEDEMAVAEEATAPEDLEWKRWANPNGHDRVRLAPLMPDRSVVVRPKSPLAYPPGTESTLYARIPVWVQLNAGPQEKEAALCEIPSLTLSNTWFGPDTTEGELCYALASTLVSDLEHVTSAPHRSICAIRVRNESEEILHLERLCIRAQHLSIYGLDGRLWSSQIKVDYQAPAEPSRVEYSDNRFRGREDAEHLAEPRAPIREGLVARSFARVASLGHFF